MKFVETGTPGLLAVFESKNGDVTTRVSIPIVGYLVDDLDDKHHAAIISKDGVVQKAVDLKGWTFRGTKWEQQESTTHVESKSLMETIFGKL